LPIFTIEAQYPQLRFARARLWRQRNVTLLHGDSRAALRSLFNGPLRSLAGRPLFFYLDAHWNDDLPLAEELDIVFAHCPAAVVMIDDFRVPGDADYGYDDYGPGRALDQSISLPLLRLTSLPYSTPRLLQPRRLALRRGCVVLAKDFLG